jgi:DNA-binding response OmpR family regulator
MKKEILIVECSKAMRFLLHTIFKKHYKVVSVPDGISAMYYLRQGNKPDLIVLDPELSDMPEWELVKHLSLSPLYNQIPLVVISSLDENQLRVNAMKNSVAEYFTKPFNPLKLVESVDMLLMGSTLHKI